MKFDTLLAVLDFLYRGEANVFQEDLDSFLAIAEELQLRGLMGSTDQRVEDHDVNEKIPPPQNLPEQMATIPGATTFPSEPPQKKFPFPS